MKINLDYQFLNMEGEPEQRNGKLLTMRRVCSLALGAPIEKENIDGEEKYSRFRLIERILGAGLEIELTPEEVVKIRQLVGKVFSTWYSGQAWKLTEGKEG